MEGRRARWVPPFRFYLFCSLVFFSISLLFPIFEPQAAPEDIADPVTFVEDAIQNEEAREFAPVALFLLMPLFAVLLKGFFRRTRRLFIEHLVHSIHLHSFGFLLLAVAWPADRFSTGVSDIVENVVGFGLLGALLLYWLTSMRRVYELAWWRTALRGSLAMALYAFPFMLALALGGIIRADLAADRVASAESDHWDALDALAAGDTLEAERLRASAIVSFLRSPGFAYDPHARYHLGRILLDAGHAARARTEAEQGLALEEALPDADSVAGPANADSASSRGAAARAKRAREGALRTDLLLLGLAAEAADSLVDLAAARIRGDALLSRWGADSAVVSAGESRHVEELLRYVAAARGRAGITP